MMEIFAAVHESGVGTTLHNTRRRKYVRFRGIAEAHGSAASGDSDVIGPRADSDGLGQQPAGCEIAGLPAD